MREEKIQEHIADLEKKLACLTAKDEIRAFIGHYRGESVRGLGQELYDNFWSKSEDTCLEIGASGEFKGSWNAAAYYQKDWRSGVFCARVAEEMKLEVSSDGETASGMWMDIGVELDAGELGMNEESSAEISKLWTSKTKDGKKYMAEWLMRYIRAEMVKENGEWRFLHVRVNELLRCPMNSDFVAWSEARFVTDGARLDEQFRSNMPFAPDKPPERMADEPTTFHWQYTWESNSKDLPHLIKGEKKYEV